MQKTKPKAEAPTELIRCAIAAYDDQIVAAQTKRAQLVALLGPTRGVIPAAITAALKPRTMSAEAKAKISAAAKKRWAKTRKAQAKKQQPKSAGKKVVIKAAKKKKAVTKKKGETVSVPATEAA